MRRATFTEVEASMRTPDLTDLEAIITSAEAINSTRAGPRRVSGTSGEHARFMRIDDGVATTRENHRSPIAGPAVRRRLWGRAREQA
jgi:hypothetical protein